MGRLWLGRAGFSHTPEPPMSTIYRWPLAALFLAVLVASTAAVAQPRMIQSGDVIEGRLASGDRVLAQDGSLYDLYLYSGRPGEGIVITLRSDDFDAYLIGGRTEAEAFAMYESDDDGAGGTDSELVTSASSSGQYYFLVNTFEAGESGAYRVGVSSAGGGTQVPSTPAAGAREIEEGDTVTGRLASGDAVLASDGSYYDLYRFTGFPGQEVTITLRSTDFDAYLIGGPTQAAAFDMYESNDDGAGGTDSELVVTASGSGDYYFLVNTFQSGQTGAYQLSVTSVGGVTPGPTTPPIQTPPVSSVIDATWGSHATSYRGRNGERFTFRCPPGTPSGSVWGTGLYTDDSRICKAGVHAGVLNASSGGLVTIEIRPGASAYTASTQNGVASNRYGSWHGSYVIVGSTLASTPGASSGQASQMTVEIDCHHSSFRWTETDNQVRVQFWSGGRLVGTQSRDRMTCSANSEPTFSLNTAETITQVRVIINGDDALFIDDLRVYRGDGSGGLGSLVRRFGVDDEGGWCLSTDPSDANGDWRDYVNSCVATQAFDL